MKRYAWAWMVCAACTANDDKPSWLLDTPDCKLVSSATIAGESAGWIGCRVYWSGTPYEVLTMELLTPATTGSFIQPGAGWLSLSISGDAPQNATLVVDNTQGSQVPVSVPTNAISAYYFAPNGSSTTKTFAEGQMAVGSNYVNLSSPSSVTFDASLEGVVLRASAASSMPLGGSIQISAAQPAPPPGDPGTVGGHKPSSGCTAGSTANCNGYTTQCASNHTAQAPCYCAAACSCHYLCDMSCETQNRASASSLGTSCAY